MPLEKLESVFNSTERHDERQCTVLYWKPHRRRERGGGGGGGGGGGLLMVGGA